MDDGLDLSSMADDPVVSEETDDILLLEVRDALKREALERASEALAFAEKDQRGEVMAYAFMQTIGMVNDHVIGCDARATVEHARAAFVRP